MGNEGSQYPPSADGTRTPMSDSGLALGATPREVPRVRRFSSASTQPPSPVEAPDLDMSHLSDSEKSQIEAVIARARELQEEEARRVREIEEEFGPLSASVPVNLSNVGPSPMCPICNDVELRGEIQNVCTDCETTVCLNCGLYETNTSTKLQEWLCSTCNERRHLANDVTLWCNGRQEDSDFDNFLEMEHVDMPIGRGMRRTTSLTKPLLDAAAEPRPDDADEIRDLADTGQGDVHYNRPHTSGGARERDDFGQKNTPKPPVKAKPIPPPKPDMSRRGSRESSPNQRQAGTGTDNNKYTADARTGRSESHSHRTRGVGQSPDSDKDSSTRHHIHSLDVDVNMQYLDDEEAVSPGGTRRKQRPQHLILNRQHSAGSTSSTSSSDSIGLVHRDRPSGQSIDAKAKDSGKVAPDHRNMDVKAQHRTGAEGAEGTQNLTGTIKKKPSALDRVGINDSIEPERCQSPSRRSPKSPPRSPSWMRYRESPPRSPPVYSISPSMSPTERFPSTYVERTSPSINREETYGEETGPPSARDNTAFNFDQYEVNNYSQVDSRNHPDRPPPKPARMSGPYQFQDELTPHTLDLATYAATVASDTAHLTNMSVSPTCNLEVPDSGDPDYLEVSPEQESVSPPSPNYFEDVDELDVTDPTPKSIDYQNSKRQRVKPPATDWSPVTDLSPILDVSPSIERLEQEKMLADQQEDSDADLLFDSPPCTIKRRPKPQQQPQQLQQTQPNSQQNGEPKFPDDPHDTLQSPLKRYEAFDDISQICPIAEKNKRAISQHEDGAPNYTNVSSSSSVTPDLIHSVRPAIEQSAEKVTDNSYSQNNTKTWDNRRGEPPTRPDLCSGKDGSAREDTAWVRKRIPIREELKNEREMDNNANKNADKYVAKRKTDSANEEIMSRKSGPRGDDQLSQSKGQANSTGGKNHGSSMKDKPSHPAHGDLERSSSTESTKSKDSSSSASKVKPKPLTLSSVAIDQDDMLLFSPHYGVLKSPVSPANKVYCQRNYLDGDLNSPMEDESERVYMYPSPVSPRDPEMSPPVPQSPSVFTDELQMGTRGHVIQPRVTRATQASFVFEEGSNLNSGSGSFDLENARILTEQNKVQSPGSPGDSSKKVRRKLPPVPPEVESPTNSSGRTRNQASAEPVPDPVAVEKERLRKKLLEKEAEKRRKDKENKSNRSSPINSKALVDTGSQTRSEESGSMSSGTTGAIRTGTNTTSDSKKTKDKPKDTQLVPQKKKPPPPPPKPKIEMVNIKGLMVPSDVKSLKQRIKEEIQITTASRRLKIDELEEIRVMERKLADREKERQQRAQEEQLYEAQLRAVEKRERELEKLKEMDKLRKESELLAINEQKLKTAERRKPTSGSTLAALRMSPQASPRRARHKRQNSDPMVAKFSPIEEVRDIENDLSYKLGLEARRLVSDLGRFAPQSPQSMRRTGAITPPPQSELLDYSFRQPLTRSSLSRSSEVLSKFSLVERDPRLSSSQSESDLLMSLTNQKALAYFGDEEDWQLKEERKHLLQMEIEKRRRALEDNAKLQYELRRLSECADISRHELEEARVRYQHYMRNKDRVPTGIIKPIDYEMEFREAEAYSQMEYAAYREMLEKLQQERFVPPHPAFSSTDYLGHQRDRPSKQALDALMGLGPTGEYLMADMWAEGQYQPPGDHLTHAETYGYQPVKHAGGVHGSYTLPQSHYAGTKDSGMSGSIPVTGFGPYYNLQPGSEVGVEPHSYSDSTSLGPTDSETSPPTDPTPAMPLLDDVTARSRSLLRDIGSRPLSDDMEKYLQAEDPLNVMFRAESDHSLAESDDVMEGGVTLRRETEKKFQPSSQESTPTQHRKYDFPTKRILLTRDPKDRSIKGNGIGLKIVGGKMLPGPDSVMGAYVSAIYPGGVADQLHGELQEGDQVLEWNGIHLTGKTYEEVQRIMSMPNGEIELVVRPGANLCSKHSATMSTLRSESCHSSYDNLDITTSDYEDLERYLDSGDGVDPDLLAAQLEDIQHDPRSPEASPSSSQQEMFLTPSMSTPGSSEPTDPPSPPPEPTVPVLGTATTEQEKPPPPRPRAPGDKTLGEIQLQLSYDDYDGTLNIHVIQARNLRPKDKNGYSDPFVKVYLLPQRIAENKRRTKYIARTLDPEWHQTLVFMKISHDDLVTKTLEVTVWDYDRFKPNDFLGEVLIDVSNDIFLDNKPHWYKLHEHSESHNAKMAKPQAMSPAPSSSSSTRSRGGGGGRGIIGNPVQGHAHGPRGHPGTRGGFSRGQPGTHAGQAPIPNQGQNHMGHGRGHDQGPALRGSPGGVTMRQRDDRRNDTRVDPRDQAHNSRTASPRGGQKPKQQTLSSSDQGATKYSPGLGRKPTTNDQKEIVESAEDVTKNAVKTNPDIITKTSSATSKSDQVKSDLVSMATLPISLSAAALATTFVVQPDAQNSPFSTSSSTFSFAEGCADESPKSHPSGSSPQKRASVADMNESGTKDTFTSGDPSTCYTLAKSSATLSRPSSVIEATATSSVPNACASASVTQNPPASFQLVAASHNGTFADARLPTSADDPTQSPKIKSGTPITSMGEILLGLREDPTYQLFSVAVVHCRGMAPAVAKQGNRDWYIKLYLRPGTRSAQVKKRKTSVQRAAVDPTFNEIFHFHTGVDVTILDVMLCVQTARIQKDKHMGQFRIDLKGLKSATATQKEIFRYYAFGPVRK